ncbi:hypothetical protein EJ06DRAFT_491783 [Trichodelitschia bisporula]|uniref:Fermentation associated protein n=1 Tax=Trichodelitschia bisporula TaxID=703511 RepID=A0A6G1I0U4_9PEZI|nr:hypothetical protein EJ06DRAFT_491783 [Trichodelitschia bisporula]
MAGGDLIAQPLNASKSFNWVLLIELLVCGILGVFFLGYFDRLVSTLISYGIRFYTWRKYHAFIDIQSLQLSLLGGRIFFKGIRYHAHNETILVHTGYITWNYWLRHVRDAKVFEPGDLGEKQEPDSLLPSKNQDEEGGRKPKNLPCRISIHLEGVQAFLYNRSPAYDAVVNHMTEASEAKHTPRASQDRVHSTSSEHARLAASAVERIASVLKSSVSSMHSRSRDGMGSRSEKPKEREHAYTKPTLPMFLKLLPIHIKCDKAAAVLGNYNTRSIITATVEGASGTIDAGKAGLLDLYKQLFEFEFRHPVVQMRTNPDFKEPQLATALRLKDNGPTPKQQTKRSPGWSSLLNLRRRFNASVESIKASPDGSGTSSHRMANLPGQERWQGLSRYMDSSLYSEHDEWDPVEYGRSSTIIDCPKIGMTFYWDVPGVVPPFEPIGATVDAVNGSAPPEYGLDLRIHGGTVTYGPWADRQRVNFQAIFFPAIWADAIPGKVLTPGETRVSTVFKIFISVEEELVLRVPVRESSKDWKWKGKAETVVGNQNGNAQAKDKSKSKRRTFWRTRDKGPVGANVRPFAWLDVKIGADSTVTYVMDMIARSSGYQNAVSADVRKMEILTSVNHGLLWRSGPLTVDCDLSAPLAWNGLREWKFNICNDDLQLFILRDHLFLLTDVITDWTSGPPPEYATFVPFRYSLNVRFRNFKLFLNTNDSNIINDPSSLEDNQFIILYGRDLHADLTIPLDKFRPVRNEISFDIVGLDLGLELALNSRNTATVFVDTKTIAELARVTFKGSHAYFSRTSHDLTDRLTFIIASDQLKINAYGFAVSRLIKLKDNYFGDDLHFKTLEEFQELVAGKSQTAESDAIAQKSNRSNDLDIIMCVTTTNISALLPANLYSVDQGIVVNIPYASGDLRLTNYYMDLQVDFSPLNVSHRALKGTSTTTTGTEIFIDSASLNGHRVFGLPPTEPTYVCTWNVAVGPVSGECSDKFLETLARSLQCLTFSIDDDENSVSLVEPLIIHDITFLQVRTQEAKVWLHVKDYAFLVSLGPASVDFNDWAESMFSMRLNLLVPDLAVACVDAKSAIGRKAKDYAGPANTFACLQTTVSVSVLHRKFHFSDERKKQQAHLLEQDSRTRRAPFLLAQEMTPSVLQTLAAEADPPAMIFPPIPAPEFDESPYGSTLSSSANSLYEAEHSLQSQPSDVAFTDVSRSWKSLRPKSSHASLASSIRRSTHASRHTGPRPSLSHAERSQRNSYHSYQTQAGGERHAIPSVKGSLAVPCFPLLNVSPDFHDLPHFEKDAENSMHLDRRYDAAREGFDEDLSHTTFIITAEPGVRGYCKPEAVMAIASLMDLLQQRDPEDLLDAFQLSVMTQILDIEKKKKGAGRSLELAVRVPSILFRFISPFDSPAHESRPAVDRYDLSVRHLTIAARSKVYPAAKEMPDRNTLHCTVGSVTVSARENPIGLDTEDLALRAQIQQLTFWAFSSEQNEANLSFHTLEFATAGKEIGYIAALIHRTTLMGNRFAATFVRLLAESKSRMAYLAYELSLKSDSIVDPPFLTKPSHAIRVAPHHLRNHDSWKIVHRFRIIYQKMDENSRQRLKNALFQGSAVCPDDYLGAVLKKWERWRVEDLAHVKKSLAMRYLFGPHLGSEDAFTMKPALPLVFHVRAHVIRLLVDPGPHQTEVALNTVVAGLSIKPPVLPEGLRLVQLDGSHPTEDVLLQASMQSFTVSVDWEITALIRNVVHLFQRESIQPITPPTCPAPPQLQPERATWRSIQVVLAIDAVVWKIGLINIRGDVTCESWRLSLLMLDKSATKEGLRMSALIHAANAHANVFAHSRLLLEGTAGAPNLYISREAQVPSTSMEDKWRITGSNKLMTIKVREEILGVLEVADKVLRDEVAYFKERFTSLTAGKFPQTPEVGITEQRLPKVTVALLMDTYRFDVALLQSLTYTLAGKLGRISVSPALHRLLSMELNFDVDEHTHGLWSHSQEGNDVISTFKLPPVNGQIKVYETKERLDLLVTMIVETVVLDATPLHALMSTFSRPEVSRTFGAIQADIAALRRRFKLIFPESPPRTPATEVVLSRSVTYNVALTLAGISVRADAPAKHPGAGIASLSLGLKRVKLRAFNASNGGSIILPLPEIHAQLQEFFVALSIANKLGSRPCGNIRLSASVHCTIRKSRRKEPKRNYRIRVDGVEINAFAETASAVVDVLNHLQDRIRDLDLSREKKYLQRLRAPTRKSSAHLMDASVYSESSMTSSGLFNSAFAVSIYGVQVSWIVGASVPAFPGYENEDLVLSIKMIDLSTKSEHSSTLAIEALQLQMVPGSQDKKRRSVNSALLPEVVFNVGYVSTDNERKMSFHAAGKSLDLLVDSKFMVPANSLQRSIGLAVDKFRDATASWQMTPTATGAQRKNPFGDKRLSSLRVDADFAGAVVSLRSRARSERLGPSSPLSGVEPHQGRYGQFTGEGAASGATLKSPGIAIKVEYSDTGVDPSLSVEVRVSGSSNTLTPTVVPIIMEISDSIKTVVGDAESPTENSDKKMTQSSLLDENLLTADPSTLLGKTRFNLGLRICKQEFSLSCQPIARVAASAKFEDIYVTANSVTSHDNDAFFSVSAAFQGLEAEVKHVYSREPTFSFNVPKIALSIMNSKHLSGTAGISAILKLYPMHTRINARQLHDFLLFREIWIPPEIRKATPSSPTTNPALPQDYLVQRYQQVATATAFPWNATVAIESIAVELELGQALGKSSLLINDMWASSRKDSNWEQNLCVGIGSIAVTSEGRMSGFVELDNFKVRTSISWPEVEGGHHQTPAIEASVGFDKLSMKAAFDYQAFAIADVASFAFLMYNVRADREGTKDRLVAILDGDMVHAYCTASGAAQGLALYQAFERLVQENQTAYTQSLRDIEKYLRRQSVLVPSHFGPIVNPEAKKETDDLKTPISLYTDVVVTLKSIDIGVFPSAFYDTQVFLVDASDVQARFAVALEAGKIHSALGMTLGQLQIAVTNTTSHPDTPKKLGEVTVDGVVHSIPSTRSGIILRVPKVIATMQTWQVPGMYSIEYIFKSRFEGKVDVGWNYSRIGIIRSIWNTHSRTLASRLGKPLPESAVRITTGSKSVDSAVASSAGGSKPASEDGKDENITAVVVNVPQSRYEYAAREPPVIETPQLRDMGEATPPLEWIGLQRDRLPNITHQIVIVALLGVAKEVEDAYGRILGNS